MSIRTVLAGLGLGVLLLHAPTTIFASDLMEEAPSKQIIGSDAIDHKPSSYWELQIQQNLEGMESPSLFLKKKTKKKCKGKCLAKKGMKVYAKSCALSGCHAGEDPLLRANLTTEELSAAYSTVPQMGALRPLKGKKLKNLLFYLSNLDLL